MITEDAQDMKWQLEHLPSKEDLRVLASEIRAVQERNFDNYITDNAYPARRSGANVQTSGIADPTAGLAVTGYERFVREKQRDLKRLVTTYRDHQQFRRLARLCFEQMPADEASLLRRHCLHGERITAIALDIGLSRATGYRKYDDAIERFTDLYWQAAVQEQGVAS